MNLSKEAMEAIQKAIALASENNYEYVTPEMVLLMILDDPSFSEAYESCGGDIVALSKNLMSYVKKYIDKTSGREPELSIATQQMVNFAGQSAFSSGCSQIHIRHLIHAI